MYIETHQALSQVASSLLPLPPTSQSYLLSLYTLTLERDALLSQIEHHHEYRLESSRRLYETEKERLQEDYRKARDNVKGTLLERVEERRKRLREEKESDNIFGESSLLATSGIGCGGPLGPVKEPDDIGRTGPLVCCLLVVTLPRCPLARIIPECTKRSLYHQRASVQCSYIHPSRGSFLEGPQGLRRVGRRMGHALVVCLPDRLARLGRRCPVSFPWWLGMASISMVEVWPALASASHKTTRREVTRCLRKPVSSFSGSSLPLPYPFLSSGIDLSTLSRSRPADNHALPPLPSAKPSSAASTAPNRNLRPTRHLPLRATSPSLSAAEGGPANGISGLSGGVGGTAGGANGVGGGNSGLLVTDDLLSTSPFSLAIFSHPSLSRSTQLNSPFLNPSKKSRGGGGGNNSSSLGGGNQPGSNGSGLPPQPGGEERIFTYIPGKSLLELGKMVKGGEGEIDGDLGEIRRGGKGRGRRGAATKAETQFAAANRG